MNKQTNGTARYSNARAFSFIRSRSRVQQNQSVVFSLSNVHVNLHRKHTIVSTAKCAASPFAFSVHTTCVAVSNGNKKYRGHICIPIQLVAEKNTTYQSQERERMREKACTGETNKREVND
jgi:hypothetical protein